jgi:hypothetical protein
LRWKNSKISTLGLSCIDYQMIVLGMTTSGRAAKTSVAQGTKIDFEVRSTGTIALVPVLRTLTVLIGLNTTDVLAALPLVINLEGD